MVHAMCSWIIKMKMFLGFPSIARNTKKNICMSSSDESKSIMIKRKTVLIVNVYNRHICTLISYFKKFK